MQFFLDVLDLYKCFPSLDLYMLVFLNVCSSVMLGFTFFNLFSHPFTLPLTSSLLFLPSNPLPFPTQSLNSFTLALLEPFTFHFPSLHFLSLPFTTLHFPSLPFTSLHVVSLPFTSLPSLHFSLLPFLFHSLSLASLTLYDTFFFLILFYMNYCLRFLNQRYIFKIAPNSHINKI